MIDVYDIDKLPEVEVTKPAHFDAKDTAYIIFTSGTTGVPKGVVISAGAARQFIQTITALLDLREDDRALEPCELTFDVSVHNMFSTWEVGASVHVLSAGRVMSALKYAKEHQLTVWSSVPSLVGMLRQIKALSPNALPNLRLSVFAGEPLPSSIASAWKTVAPNTVIENLYGPTEATVYCLRQIADEPPSLTPGRDFFAIGNPLPGCEAAIVDADNHFVARGVTGELAIAGPQLADGYLNAPELTQARFPVIDGKRWYLTGDLAMQDADGIFHCLGRIDNQVKVLGNRVELEEVDAHLRLIADTSVAATVAWPVVDGSVQGLVAFVGANSEGAIDSEQIIASLKAKLPAYMVPSRVHALADMPFNPSGKVDRRALRRLLEDGAL